jgi:non-specific serine/threonine protein kinase
MESREEDRDDLLLVTPSGRVAMRAGRDMTALAADLQEAVAAFATSSASGLFALAALESSSGLSPVLAYWQGFAREYVTRLCQTPELFDRAPPQIEPPSREQLDQLALGAPPMTGAEYLSADVLEALWRELDAWTRAEIAATKAGLSGFLQQRAPSWHQVGRVCFHLAENKRDPDYPFAFMATYIPGLSAKDKARYLPLGKALEQYAGAQNKPALVRLLSPVQRATEQSEYIRNLVASGDIYHPLAWTAEEAYRFLKEAPLYEAAGVLVRLPDWWHKCPRPKVGAVIGQEHNTTLDADTLLDFRVGVALDDESLTEKEWIELLAGDDGLVLFKGRWVEVDRARLEAALEQWRDVEQAARDGMLTFSEGMRMLAGVPANLDATDATVETTAEWSFVRPGKWLEETLQQLRDPKRSTDANNIPGLQANLRKYQAEGVQWLWLLTRLGLGACLADDMGLGKTLQVLALLLKLQQDQRPDASPSLVVLPASLLANWKAEIARFAPTLSAVYVHSSEMDQDALQQLAAAPEKHLQGVDVVLTTYGMLARQPWLSDMSWRLVVLDEAQAIKNPAASQTRKAKALRAPTRIAMTGTPVENRLSDLWSLFDFIAPGLLGSATKFKKFVKALGERTHDRYAPLRNLVRPYILRRLKTDKSIISDLPDKSEVKAYCGLSKRQAALYQRAVEELAAAMEGVDGIKRRGIVLSYLMRFKQICNHPSQAIGDGEYRPVESGKFARLTELCEEIASRQEKVLVFTQFRELTNPLQALLADVFGQSGLVLHGGTDVKQRRKHVEAFQREDGPPFFILSLKAGGTGLNLTAASHVVHFDRWWNPAVENQATDRAFRIGQTRNVLVHKFICRGTVEERIDALIEDKRALSDDLLTGGAEKLLTEMSDRELLDLVTLDIDKAAL